MSTLFFVVSFFSLIAMVAGIIRPKTVIRWGEGSRKSRKKVVKTYGLLFLVTLILSVYLTPDSTTTATPIANSTTKASAQTTPLVSKPMDTSSPATQTTATEPKTTEPAKVTPVVPNFYVERNEIERYIANHFKTENYSIEISELDKKLMVAISLDEEDGRFTTKEWCAINGLDIINSIQKDNPELAERIASYEFIFYAENKKKFSSKNINSKDEVQDSMKLVSMSTDKTYTVTKDDIDQFYAEIAKKEEEAIKAAQKEERAAYNSGITFDNLARNPDKYVGEKVKFKGKVLQVMETDDETQLRIAVDEDYDDVILVFYPSLLTESRILEDDIITIRGISKGLYSYETVLGAKLSVPLISVEMID